MDLDIDFNQIMNDLESSEESEVIIEPKYSELGFSIYRHIPHNDHVSALYDFELAAIHIESELSNYHNEHDRKEKFLEIISNYAQLKDWYVLYGEDLSIEFKLISDDFFNKE